ncbi:MAG: S-methyl-5-thioribose-1-phosphate isomerase [Chlorobi bacterium]|nr:S-methyl-5-thioribose-1-phosphate isomerase [Chlorobiota bacterium]
MRIKGKHYRSIWVNPDNPKQIQTFDQRKIPFKITIETWESYRDAVRAIKEMHVRGAPLIGVSGAYGLYLATLEAPEDNPLPFLEKAKTELENARPTAVNLSWAVNKVWKVIKNLRSIKDMRATALSLANQLADDDVKMCRSIGEAGLPLIEEMYARTGKPVNILTHCNAGWIATIDYGTITAPIYLAHRKGIPVHVWVSETRPRNQGSRITAWELGEEGVPHTVIADNASGLIMQEGKVDIVLVGADRVVRNGDTANKIGTNMKAVVAKEYNIPFYVALPSSTFDPSLESGDQIPIEVRSEEEVLYTEGWLDNDINRVRVAPFESHAYNPAFDVTPAKFVTGYITDKGLLSVDELSKLVPDASEAKSMG